MLNAGIEIDSNAIKKVDEVRENVKDFVVFKVKDNRVLVHDSSFPETEEDVKVFYSDDDRERNWLGRVYPRLLDVLKNEEEPVYVVLDFRYIINSHRRTKLYFIGWCPDKAPVKQRMIFSSTFKQFADKVNVPVRITAHTPSDVTYKELLARSEKF